MSIDSEYTQSWRSRHPWICSERVKRHFREKPQRQFPAAGFHCSIWLVATHATACVLSEAAGPGISDPILSGPGQPPTGQRVRATIGKFVRFSNNQLSEGGG